MWIAEIIRKVLQGVNIGLTVAAAKRKIEFAVQSHLLGIWYEKKAVEEQVEQIESQQFYELQSQQDKTRLVAILLLVAIAIIIGWRTFK